MTWMRQPHYYIGLYPYTYSVGLVAATALAEKVAQEGASAVQRWLEVLRAGGTLEPLELMRSRASTCRRRSRSATRWPMSAR